MIQLLGVALGMGAQGESRRDVAAPSHPGRGIGDAARSDAPAHGETPGATAGYRCIAFVRCSRVARTSTSGLRR
jgi:hypothetical protein